MEKEVWLKDELVSRGHGVFNMPVREFIDWCHNRLKEIPDSMRDSALLNIDIADYATGDIEIAVSYTSSDVASNDADVQAARRELEKEANFRPFSEFKNELDGGNDAKDE